MGDEKIRDLEREIEAAGHGLIARYVRALRRHEGPMEAPSQDPPLWERVKITRGMVRVMIAVPGMEVPILTLPGRHIPGFNIHGLSIIPDRSTKPEYLDAFSDHGAVQCIRVSGRAHAFPARLVLSGRWSIDEAPGTSLPAVRFHTPWFLHMREAMWFEIWHEGEEEIEVNALVVLHGQRVGNW